MPKFGPIKRRELIKILQALGFEGPFPGGKHPFMERGELTLTIPNHHSGDIGRDLLKLILEQADISKKQWEAI